MKALICTQCGAPINRERMICEYCGTKYEQKHEKIVKIEAFQTRPVVIEGVVSHDKYLADAIDSADMSRMICSQIASRISDELTKYIDYRIQEDPYTRNIITKGRVRVLPPDYRF